ncbi:MAG: hypothetical protein U1E04_03450 [Hylemonella sp.]|nr:hypothetical protein [Hylemonella sp.]
MKSPANDIVRLQNMIDGLERIVIESKTIPDELDSAELVRTKNAMRHIFAASAARAKLSIDASERGTLGNSISKTKRAVPLAVQIRELTAMLLTRPELEPRLRAVFDNSQELEEAEIDKVIDDIGKILLQKDNGPNKTKSKKPKGS